MFDKIFSTLTEAVVEKNADQNEPDFNLPEEKMEQAFALAKDTIMSSFLGKADEDDDEGNEMGFASVLNLFNGKSDIGSSSIVSNIITKFGAELIEKLGVPESMSHAAASFIIPKVLSSINDSTPEDGLKKNDITSLLGDTAVDLLKNKGGSIGSLVGGLFG